MTERCLWAVRRSARSQPHSLRSGFAASIRTSGKGPAEDSRSYETDGRINSMSSSLSESSAAITEFAGF